jgi:metacaspase-1
MAKTRAYAIVIGSGLLQPTGYGGCKVRTKSCENDAVAMTRFARRRGFTLIGPHDSHAPFLSKQALKDDIKKAVRKAASELKRGDMLLLFYAGHGASLPVGRKKNQEIWCFSDGRLWDLEWDHLRAEFADGVKLVIVSDSCYSGGFGPPEKDDPREPNSVRCPRPRVLGKDCLQKVSGNSANEFKLLRRKLGRMPRQRAKVLLLAACQANQVACASRSHGVFTRKLLEVAKDRALSYAGVFHHVRRKFPSCQSPFLWQTGRGSDEFREEKAFQP